MGIIPSCADIMSLPDWWISAVVIEYFDCRRYVEDGKLGVFDFKKLSDHEIRSIQKKQVIAPGFMMVQNIRYADLEARMPLARQKLPMVKLEDADLIPEGLVNKTGYPYFADLLYLYDHKLKFGPKAIVKDSNFFYQWDIEKMMDYYQSKSDPIDLSEFLSIKEKLQEYEKSPRIKQPDQQFKNDVEEAYKELEVIRKKLRQKILDYHNSEKVDYDTSNVDVPTPPMLSYFDGIKYEKGKYQVKTHMAPVFLRSAIRSLNRAADAKEKRNSNPKDYDSLLDEIEYSAMCITSATNCLEAYINYIIGEYLPDESKILTSISHGKKWILVTVALDLSFRFKSGKAPYSDFSRLVNLRNNTIHHKADYDSAEGEISKTYNQLNIRNAKFAIKVVRNMVTKLSEDEKIPLPTWIKTYDASATYWDEVSEYLKKM